MPTPSRVPLLTTRDLEILAALDRCPLTAAQLLKLSQSFALPFTGERRVRERLHTLATAERVHPWQYATAGRGAPNYYVLSRLGYRLLHGPKAILPHGRCFRAVGIAHQHHTQCLADFIVHTAVSAHQAGLAFTGFYGENALRLQVGEDALFPDCAFQLITPSGASFSFFVEVDNSSESVRSEKSMDSWQRKLRLYEAFATQSAQRFRLLVVTTRASTRLGHILEAADETLRRRERSLVYGVNLAHYLAQAKAVSALCFTDHRKKQVPLVPRQAGTIPQPSGQPARVAAPKTSRATLPSRPSVALVR